MENQLTNKTWVVDACLLFVVIFGFYCLSISVGHFIIPDEGRYAEIAREMLVRHDFVTPTLDFAKYLQKPPLYYWMVAGSFKLFGASIWSARLVSAFMASIGCVVTYLGGRALFDRRTGLVAAMVLATSLLFFLMAHFNNIDMSLSVLLSISLLSFIVGIKSQGRQRFWLLMSFYAFSALSLLAKGLIGAAFPAMIVGLWGLIYRDWGLLRRINLLLGLLVFVVIALPWHVLVELKTPGFLYYYFVDQQFIRFVHYTHTGHVMSLGNYLILIVASLVPWVVFVPVLIKNFSCQFKENYINQSPVIFLWIWFLVIAIFFALASQKLISYVLPLAIPYALVVGYYLANRLKDECAWLRLMLSVVATVATIVGVAAWGLLLFRSELFFSMPHEILTSIKWLSTILIAFGCVLFVLRKRRLTLHAFSFVVGVAVILLMVNIIIEKADRKSTIKLAQVLQPLLVKYPDSRLGAYLIYPQDFPFYIRHKVYVYGWASDEFLFALKFDKNARKWLKYTHASQAFCQDWLSHRRMFVVMSHHSYTKLTQICPLRVKLRDEAAYCKIASTYHYVLVGNKSCVGEKKQ